MHPLGPKTDAYYKRMREALFSTTVEEYRPVLTNGNGVWCEDIDGNKFLDFTSQVGVTNIGFSPRAITGAIAEQFSTLSFAIANDFQFSCSHRYSMLAGQEVSPVALAEELKRITPVPAPKKVLFEVSGATAINASAKICLEARRGLKSDVIEPELFCAFEKAFHGRHGFSLDISNSKPIHKLLHEQGFDVLRIAFPRRNVFRGNYFWLNDALSRLDTYKERLNAVYAEIVQGEGGIVIPDIGVLDALIKAVHNRGILFIADEIQTGFGRTGKLFACDYLSEKPDIMILSKSLGGGMPLGAVIARSDILPNGDLPQGTHSGTMPACPMAVATALANLKILQDRDLVANSAKMGAYMLEKLQEIKSKFNGITMVDSLGGLMICVECINVPYRDALIMESLRQRPGLLLIGAGERVIRFMPPLVVTQYEIEQALSIFESALNALSHR